jgi:hypothetical protein
MMQRTAANLEVMLKNISANPDDNQSEIFVFQSMLVRAAGEAGGR